MENVWQYTHAKCKTSPCSNSLPKQEWWLLGNTLISTRSTPPTDRQSLSHVEESKNDSAPIERNFHSTVKSPTKASMLTAVCISPFLSFWSSCVKRRVQGAVDDWLHFGSVRVCSIGTFQFLKYCDEFMVRSWTQLNPENRPMLNTVSCVKLYFHFYVSGSHTMPLSLNTNMLCNKSLLTLQFQGIHWTQFDLYEHNRKMAQECAFDVLQKLAWH